MLIDCHVHLDTYKEEEIHQILRRARQAGIKSVISAGTTLESSQRSIELGRHFPEFYSGVGIHPTNIKVNLDDSIYGQLKNLALSSKKVLVISEIGLDFMEGAPDKPLQYQAFREQIRLARDVDMPIIFHSRESHDEVFRLLREEQAYTVGGAMHYFQGDERTANQAIDLGFYISLSGILTFKNANDLREIIKDIPIDRLLLETDSPYLAPVPERGKRNEPSFIIHTAKKAADIKNLDHNSFFEITTNNFFRLFSKAYSKEFNSQ